MPPPRPRWQANKKQPPQKAQKTPKLQKAKAVDETPIACIPVELQQLLLNIFKHAFTDRFAEDIKPLLQEVKGHLYNRDFGAAFGKKDYLEAYAARWSASRALGYADLLWDLKGHLWPDKVNGGAEKITSDTDEQSRPRRILCLGGGAGAELVALAGILKMSSTATTSADDSPTLDVTTVDITDWTSVVDNLTQHATTAPPLSKYASAAVKAGSTPLVSAKDFIASFRLCDILDIEPAEFATLLSGVGIVTLMFTLNELYSTSTSLTQRFLLNLTSALSTGALLLVVDSPGSYSTIALNGAEKKYPMQWLLDHTLLDQTGEKGAERRREWVAKWEKIHEDESRWFRLNPALQYPIDLENMRMQVHLYRRL